MGDAARIQWAKGGQAVVVALREDAVTLRSTIPSPPGSRIEGTLAHEGAEGATPAAPQTVRVKVYSSKRQEDGSFVLEGRVLDLTRAVRARLAR